MSKPISTGDTVALPLISVVMPCFNAEAYLQEAVECVFEQSYPKVELIVIDDGSTDQSLKILEALQKMHPQMRILEQQNMGPYPARNRGLDHARGEYIAFLDSDDYWAKDCLEKLYTRLTSAGADLTYCGWQNVMETGHDGAPYVPPAYEEEDIIKCFLHGCPWPIHAALVKRPVISLIKGFSTQHFSSMDYDFWLRILTVTRNIALVPEVLAYYRWHDKGQISSIKWRQVLDAWQVRKDFVLANPQLVAHIPTNTLDTLVNGQVTKQAYDSFWKRDFDSAKKLFNALLCSKRLHFKDVKYIAICLLPISILKRILK